ncbi:MAG: methyltransferase domain-containing protein [Candidatus Aminicenantes bacterium]|nr:methyltransferase domain-containing protein [Candidatus Aminicenantes bacterium]
MRRIIEELVEKRKTQQEKLRQAIDELGTLIGTSFFLKKRKSEIKQKLGEFNNTLEELITAQDREWDAYNNNHSTSVFKSLEWKIGKLEAEYSNVKTLLVDFITLEASLQRLIDAVDRESAERNKEHTLKTLKEIKDRLSVYQYSDFEQRFRGDEQEVKNKLKRYLPIFAIADNILDVGCGRGEFLELLQEQGKKAVGIDISESMLRSAAGKSITCKKAAALEYLQQEKDNSCGGIFSSQVIEHLQPEYLRDVVREAYRVLTKNAPIVLETINPLSIFALSNIYFLDITHQKPLHPEYMRYLLESCGFSEVEIIYSDELNEEKLLEIAPQQQSAREFNTNVDKLNKMLFAAPVYAVTGIKR